ncbi:Malolactic regulator [Lacticaseibacillus rhamnosus]|nr:Malolactic regulator [Lacticaseibacillus rhamnosus]
MDLGRNGQNLAITAEAAYVLVYAHNALPGAGICV